MMSPVGDARSFIGREHDFEYAQDTKVRGVKTGLGALGVCSESSNRLKSFQTQLKKRECSLFFSSKEMTA